MQVCGSKAIEVASFMNQELVVENLMALRADLDVMVAKVDALLAAFTTPENRVRERSRSRSPPASSSRADGLTAWLEAPTPPGVYRVADSQESPQEREDWGLQESQTCNGLAASFNGLKESFFSNSLSRILLRVVETK